MKQCTVSQNSSIFLERQLLPDVPSQTNVWFSNCTLLHWNTKLRNRQSLIRSGRCGELVGILRLGCCNSDSSFVGNIFGLRKWKLLFFHLQVNIFRINTLWTRIPDSVRTFYVASFSVQWIFRTQSDKVFNKTLARGHATENVFDVHLSLRNLSFCRFQRKENVFRHARNLKFWQIDISVYGSTTIASNVNVSFERQSKLSWIRQLKKTDVMGELHKRPLLPFSETCSWRIIDVTLCRHDAKTTFFQENNFEATQTKIECFFFESYTE